MVIQQTKLFIGHTCNEDKTGKLLLSKLEYTQIITGIKHQIIHKNTPTHLPQMNT